MDQNNIVIQVGVKSFLINKENNILLMKRNPLKYQGMEEVWDIPGGRINDAEDLETNLKREIFEETGIKSFKILQVLGAQDIMKKDKHVVRVTYISRVTSNKVTLSDEHIEYRWVTLKELIAVKTLDSYARSLLKDKNIMSFISTLAS